MKRVLLLAVASGCLAGSASAMRIAVFDAARGGDSAYAVSPVYSQLRNRILTEVANCSFVEVNTLTTPVLDSVDVLMISSVYAGHQDIGPISAAEQAALGNFVATGGTAILVTDNASFGGNAPASNESLIDPFGLDTTGVQNGPTGVTVINFANPITNGPFGVVTETSYSYSGYYYNIPSAFTVLANVDAFAAPGIVFAPKGALGVGHGAVLAFSDCSFHANDWSPPGQTLILNALAYAAPPRQISGTVDLQDYSGPMPSVDIELRPVGSGDAVLYAGVPLGGAGSYVLGTRLTGDYDVWAKSSHWLGQLSPAGTIHLSGSVSGVNFSLENGDVNRDNEVSIGDYSILSFAYNSFPGDPNWVDDADLNGDEAVDIGDYSILSLNYGEFGD